MPAAKNVGQKRPATNIADLLAEINKQTPTKKQKGNGDAEVQLSSKQVPVPSRCSLPILPPSLLPNTPAFPACPASARCLRFLHVLLPGLTSPCSHTFADERPGWWR